MLNKKVELPMPIFFIVLSVCTIIYCTRIPWEEAVFLLLISGIILVSAIALLMNTLHNQTNTVDSEGVNLKKVLILLLVLALYTFSLKFIGYIPATLILGIFVIRFLGYRSWTKNIVFCVLVTLGTYAVFHILLSVPLPAPFFMD